MKSIFGIETLVALAQSQPAKVKYKIKITPAGVKLEVIADPTKPKLCAAGREYFEAAIQPGQAISERHNSPVENKMLEPLPEPEIAPAEQAKQKF